MRTSTLLLFSIFCLVSAGCRPIHSWETIYQKQNSLFLEKRNVFEKALETIDKLNMESDTIIKSKDFRDYLGKETADSLSNLNILSIEYRTPKLSPDRNGKCRDILFKLGEKWESDKFSVLTVWNSECDDRSKNNYHWKMKESEHKHSFGFGKGWFLYSDTDRDPF